MVRAALTVFVVAVVQENTLLLPTHLLVRIGKIVSQVNIYLPMAQVALTVYVVAAVQGNILLLPMLILVRTGQIVWQVRK